MLNIIFFSPHDLPSAHISRNFDYAKRLSKAGHKIKIIVNNFSHRGKARIENPGGKYYVITIVDDVQVIWLNTVEYKSNGMSRALNAISYLFYSIRYVIGELKHADVCIGDSVPPTAGLAAYLASFIKKAKFIYQVRDVWPAELVYLKAIKRLSTTYYALRILEVFLYKKAFKIYSTLPLLKPHIEKSGGDPEKVVYLPNGVDLSLFKYKPPESDHNRILRVMYAGGFSNTHDVESIVRAAALLNTKNMNLLFDIYGDGFKLKATKQLTQKFSLKNVNFFQPIRKIDLAHKLSKADILVAAVTDSEAYKFGMNLNKIYDYLAIGRPIILAIKSPHRPIEDARCGYTIPPENFEILTDSIQKICALTQTERITLGLNARRFAETNYDINKLAIDFETHLLK